MIEKQQAFAEACSQIIPVLVLALLADPVGRKARISHSGLILFALVAGLLGESLALLAVAVGTDATTNKLIILSMLILFVAIVAPHATQHADNIRSAIPPEWRYIIGQVFYYASGLPFIIVQTISFSRWFEVAGWTALGVVLLASMRHSTVRFRAIKRGETDSEEARSASEEVPNAGDQADDLGEPSEEAAVASNERGKLEAEK